LPFSHLWPIYSLSKVIALRWKELSEPGREFYKDVARADQEKYDEYIALGGQ
jgi:hypothetical protein